MMLRSLLIAGSFLVACLPAVSADMVPVVSSITQAVVYPGSARVTRTAKVDLKEGQQTVVFQGVQPNFDENSLAVSGAGTASVKIQGVGIKGIFLNESVDGRVKALEAKVRAAEDELAALQNEVMVLDHKRAFLDSVKLFTGNQLPKDMASKVPSVEELKGTLSFIEEGYKLYGDGMQSVLVRQREKSNERQRLMNELNQVRSNTGKQERVLSVDVECAKAGSLALEVSYTVGGVSWYPVYDARVAFDKAKASLSAFALIHQTTGEDWTDVALTLSTARPSVGGRMPEIHSSWYLMPAMPRQNLMMKTMARGMAMENASFGHADKNDEMVMDAVMPMAAPIAREADVSYAQAETTGVSLVYKAGRPVTVKSDGSETRVPLLVQELDASFEYAATPKLSTFAYLKSEVANGDKDQIMAGRVNVFLDGTYVGNSDIQKTVAPKEKFDLCLGVDEGVSVKREQIEKKTDDTLIGGIPSPVRKTSYVYKITVESFKSKPALFKVFDQIPVAQDDKIRVTRLQVSLKPETEKYKDREGVYMWSMMLNSGEKKEILVSYTVEAPRDMVVSGL